MQKDVVSILTPCYNTGKLLHRLLDSVLMQDYPSVEMFCIDDGSTDNTREVIESYIPKFTERGYSLTYVHQENGGQSVAINNGLKLVNGEYLMWPDSDDYYNNPNALNTFVSLLKENRDDIAVVRSLPINVSEVDTHEISRLEMNDELSQGNQFLNCLNSAHFIWPPVNYMIKMKAFDSVNPRREIYTEKNAGQNWQMLLPLLYSYKCHTLNDYFACVLIRENSHSRGQYKGFRQMVAKFSSYRNTILSTLDKISAMPAAEKDSHKKHIVTKYKVQELQLAIQYHENEAIAQVDKELMELGAKVEKTRRLQWWISSYFIGRLLIRIINKVF